MKIKNISNATGIPTDVLINLERPVGDNISVTLKPGQVIYSQTDTMTKPLIIYSRKNILKISNEIKPLDVDYYVAHTDSELGNQKQSAPAVKTKEEVIENKKEEVQPQKNKGGRPKGSKNKRKPGRPKGSTKKRPKGRPKGSTKKKSKTKRLKSAEENAQKYIEANKS